nr:MAG TPA: hypothetical protein [Bacteriophage sp.]
MLKNHTPICFFQYLEEIPLIANEYCIIFGQPMQSEQLFCVGCIFIPIFKEDDFL